MRNTWIGSINRQSLAQWIEGMCGPWPYDRDVLVHGYRGCAEAVLEQAAIFAGEDPACDPEEYHRDEVEAYFRWQNNDRRGASPAVLRAYEMLEEAT